MKILIWGCGARGKDFYSRLSKDDKDNVIAFIDSNEKLVGSEYEGKRIISFEEYEKRYIDYFIVISPVRVKEIRRTLEEKGIYQYFELNNCPAELQRTPVDGCYDRYLDTLCMGKNYGLFGLNFFSVYFYEKLSKRNDGMTYIIVEQDMSIQKIEIAKKIFKDVQFIQENEMEEKVDIILTTTLNRDANKRITRIAGNRIKVEDSYDLIKKIPEYKNERLIQFKNRHIGESCFIVATGPSLRISDLEILRKNKVKSFSMNRVYRAFDQTAWRPDFYVVEDFRCIQESREEIIDIPVKYKFISDSYSPFWNGDIPQNIYKVHGQLSWVENELPKYTEDIKYGVYTCGTVVYNCFQLATYMGFKEIYLIGADFNFSGKYKNVNNHFIKNYYDSNSQTAEFYEEEQLRSYKAAKEYANEHGIKIYNATRGGKLEIFPRVDFDSLFT